jgi:lipid II:glycine glycyltransferase (peptidoglycan interpeptide bridge formation enzyme)
VEVEKPPDEASKIIETRKSKLLRLKNKMIEALTPKLLKLQRTNIEHVLARIVEVRKGKCLRMSKQSEYFSSLGFF